MLDSKQLIYSGEQANHNLLSDSLISTVPNDLAIKPRVITRIGPGPWLGVQAL
jgi:hypothetical protein